MHLLKFRRQGDRAHEALRRCDTAGVSIEAVVWHYEGFGVTLRCHRLWGNCIFRGVLYDVLSCIARDAQPGWCWRGALKIMDNVLQVRNLTFQPFAPYAFIAGDPLRRFSAPLQLQTFIDRHRNEEERVSTRSAAHT